MIYDLEKVDLIITEKDNPMQLCLGISDEIQWEHHIEEHLFLLKEKLDNYVTFILNKGYEATIPNKEFDEFVIKIFFACVPDEKARFFLDTYQNVLEKDGIPIQICYEIVNPNDAMHARTS